MNCHNPKAECDGGMRPLSAERLLFIRQHFSEWNRCPLWFFIRGRIDRATNCAHRFDESSALFATPCMYWSYWGNSERCASCLPSPSPGCGW